MPSDWPSAEANAASARLTSPRWKKPSSGPLPVRQGPNLCPRGPMPSRSELKRRLRESAEAAALALAEEEAAHGSHGRGRVDGVQRLWSDADEVNLLAAAAAFRERTGRAPRRPDAGALFDAIKGSVSPDIDLDKAYDRLNGFESAFLQGTLGPSEDSHGCRVRGLCAGVWGAVGVEAGEQDVDEGRLVADGGESDTDGQRLAAERTSKPAALPHPHLDARTTSKGPSASPIDADVVPTLPSPSRSMKRSFHLQSGVPSPRSLGDIASLAHAAAAAARGSDDVDGEHDEVQSHGTAAVRTEVGVDTAQRLERADHGAARGSHKVWSDADEVALLNAAVAFRERTGRVPSVRDAGVLLRSIRGSIFPHIDESKAYHKLDRLKRMFRHEAPGECATAHDRRVHDLSAKVWGVVARDQGVMMPVVREMLGEFWKVNERAMAGLPLEKGLSLLGKREARLIETKWRLQLDEEMQTQMQRHDLAKEICKMLYDTITDLGPSHRYE